MHACHYIVDDGLIDEVLLSWLSIDGMVRPFFLKKKSLITFLSSSLVFLIFELQNQTAFITPKYETVISNTSKLIVDYSKNKLNTLRRELWVVTNYWPIFYFHEMSLGYKMKCVKPMT
jgi:hypothetical protein